MSGTRASHATMSPCADVESPPAASRPHRPTGQAPQHAPCRAQAGGEGRIRTSEAARATDLQSVAFDRSATSPMLVARLRRTPACGRRCVPPGTALGLSLSGVAYCRFAPSSRFRWPCAASISAPSVRRRTGDTDHSTINCSLELLQAGRIDTTVVPSPCPTHTRSRPVRYHARDINQQ